MKSKIKRRYASDIGKGKKPYDQAAVDMALVELEEEVAKRFPSLFPRSIKGVKPGVASVSSTPRPRCGARADFEGDARPL